MLNIIQLTDQTQGDIYRLQLTCYLQYVVKGFFFIKR